jgi:hypothetical protein
MVNDTNTVEPTFTGYVATTQDALILFEACLTGVLHHVPRRPHYRERVHLVRSGSVFVYGELLSGIKRWTDGLAWSPSRMLGNFLVYRELEKPAPWGRKKRAMKQTNRRPLPLRRLGEPYPRYDSNVDQSYSPSPTGLFGEEAHQSDVERALVGSLVDTYSVKDSGLVKKTMSVTVSGVTHHLVSYYSVEDVMSGILYPPSMVNSLQFIRPRAELTQKQSFRVSAGDLETGVMEKSGFPSHVLYECRPQLVLPPGYGTPTPHSDFYMHTNPYVSTSQPKSAAITAFPMEEPTSAQQSPNPCLPAPVPTQVPRKIGGYTHFQAPAPAQNEVASERPQGSERSAPGCTNEPPTSRIVRAVKDMTGRSR